MDKKKKFWTIALISLLAAVLVFVIVYWAINGKEETIALFERVKDFINQPLPIIGISFVTAAVILVKLISMSSWGKKALAEQEQRFKDFKAEQEKEREEDRKAFDLYKQEVADSVSEILGRQKVSEGVTESIVGFIRGLPYKGAKDFNPEPKKEAKK